MDIEQLRTHCLSKPGVTEEFPFDNETLVFKIVGKIFLLTSLKNWEVGEAKINIKCDPKKAIKLREDFPDQVFPGYHMNKNHWNTIAINTGFSDQKIYGFINDSYKLVVNKLTVKVRRNLDKE